MDCKTDFILINFHCQLISYAILTAVWMQIQNVTLIQKLMYCYHVPASFRIYLGLSLLDMLKTKYEIIPFVKDQTVSG